MRVKLQKIRESHGFTQQQFADIVGISRNHYGQIETGVKNPGLDVALRIKNALGYTKDDIWENIFFCQSCPDLGHKEDS